MLMTMMVVSGDGDDVQAFNVNEGRQERIQSRQWIDENHRSVGRMGHFLDRSYGSWVDVQF